MNGFYKHVMSDIQSVALSPPPHTDCVYFSIKEGYISKEGDHYKNNFYKINKNLSV